jgi:predicted glycogen debranching enzyme
MEISMPKIFVDTHALSNVNEALKREWLITNGLGGYASSTILGVNTRKYHGLLIAAFNPPTDRRVLLTQLNEEIHVGNKICSIGVDDPKSGLHGFTLKPFPSFKYIIDQVKIEKTVFMLYGRNVTIISYKVSNNSLDKVLLRVFPLVNSRHFHAVTNKNEISWSFLQNPSTNGVLITPSIFLSALLLLSKKGSYTPSRGEWIENYFPVEAFRGESCHDHSYQSGFFDFETAPHGIEEFLIVAAAGKNEEEARSVVSSLPIDIKGVHALLKEELRRRQRVLQGFNKQNPQVSMEEWLKWLLLAADSFIVHRKSTNMKSVIAGYHWFEDWGRDSLISLPGLTLVTGRFQDAKEILLTFKHHCYEGLIPNRFPDRTGDKPEYNTVDATLWYFNAVLQFLKYTNDFEFVHQELWDTLRTIIAHHKEGTLYNIRMDDDGLLMHGPQLTWMDVLTNGKPVTPRDGKAVEIQALWYNALKTMELLAKHFGQTSEAQEYLEMAEKTKSSFLEKFWNPAEGYLYDVIKNDYQDSSLRPNQLIAVSLDFIMLNPEKMEKIIGAAWKNLWGKYGLRTLAPFHPDYHGKYEGNRTQRDYAYHNGTVWAWLTGPFTTAFLKTKRYLQKWRNFAFENFLKPLFQEATFKAGLGTISEIFDGEPPHEPRGCIAQAWSVAEPLRAYIEDVLLKRPPYEQRILRDNLSVS